MEAIILVVLTVVKEGLDLEEEKESDGEFTLLFVLLLMFDDACVKCVGVDDALIGKLLPAMKLDDVELLA